MATFEKGSYLRLIDLCEKNGTRPGLSKVMGPNIYIYIYIYIYIHTHLALHLGAALAHGSHEARLERKLQLALEPLHLHHHPVRRARKKLLGVYGLVRVGDSEQFTHVCYKGSCSSP